MKQDSVFDNLVRNGFDFLNKALQEFDAEPKFSVIHFYTALELFLKARLLREHWTLTLTKPEQGDIAKFRVGNFHSINLDDAEKRLRDILQEGLTTDEIKCFRDLRDHRNRMVHFFHAGAEKKQSEIVEIVSLQCKGWYHLHSLLAHRWEATFAKHKNEIIACDMAMRKHRQFLQARFSVLEAEILAKTKAGSVFHECPSCGFSALEEVDSDFPALEFNCAVCNFSSNGVSIECPDCSKQMVLIEEPWHHCPDCGHAFSDVEVKSLLSDWHV